MEIKLYHNNRNSLFYIVYRPPQSNFKLFTEEFEPFLTGNSMSFDHCVYLGDFNLWMNDPTDAKASNMSDILIAHNLTNLINVPTHVSGNNLDLLIVKLDSSMILDVEVEPIST